MTKTKVKAGWVGPMKQSKDGKRPYYCDYGDWDTGKKLRQRLGYTRDEARKAYADFVQKMEAKTHTPNSTRTFGDALDAYEKRCEERHRLWTRAGKPVGKSKEWLAGNTLRTYRNMLRAHIRPRLGHIRLHELNTRDHLQPLINDLAAKSAALHSHAGNAIKKALELAVDIGWLAVSPLTLRKLSVPPVAEPKTSIPTIEEGREIWLALQERDRGEGVRGEDVRAWFNRVAMASVAMFGGMERAVAAALQWPDIDWCDGVIHIRRAHSRVDGDKGPKNKFRIRTIPMSEEIRSSLIAVWAREGKPSDGYVFYTMPGRGGTRESLNIAVGNALRRVQIKLGYVDDRGKPKWSYHEMRHYAGSIWLEAGASIHDVSRMLGHNNIQTTQKRYIHYFKKQEAERHRAIADKVSDMHRLPSAARALPAPMREICEIDAEDIEVIE